MDKTIVVASGNKHKIKEIGELLSKYNIISMADVGFCGDIIEDGTTIFDNAMIKAKAIRKFLDEKGLKYSALADDSGLFCNGINGEPGVHSARYAKDDATDEDNRQKLLMRLNNNEDRSASFKCVIVLLNADNTYFLGQGETSGYILKSYEGDTSFGYDCLFYSHALDMSFGDATDEEKNSVSHRGRAIRDLLHEIEINNRRNVYD